MYSYNETSMDTRDNEQFSITNHNNWSTHICIVRLIVITHEIWTNFCDEQTKLLYHVYAKPLLLKQ